MAKLLLDKRNVDCDDPRPIIIWDIKNGIRIQDLDETMYDDCLEFIKSEYIPRHIIWRSIDLLENENYLAQFLFRLKFIMSAKCSIVAIDIETNRILGVVLMLPMRHDFSTWQFIAMHNTNFNHLQSYLLLCSKLASKLDEQETYDTSCALHYFVVASDQSQKNKSFKEMLLMQAYKMARSMGIPTATVGGESYNNQERIQRVGMKCVGVINYDDFVDNDKTPIFNNLGSGQNFNMLFAYTVGPQILSSWITEVAKDCSKQ